MAREVNPQEARLATGPDQETERARREVGKALAGYVVAGVTLDELEQLVAGPGVLFEQARELGAAWRPPRPVRAAKVNPAYL